MRHYYKVGVDEEPVMSEDELHERRVAEEEAKRRLTEIVDRLIDEDVAYTIERDGQPAAALVPWWWYRAWQNTRGALFDNVLGESDEAGITAEAAWALAEEAKQRARANRRKADLAARRP
jgi:hypothetical protein